MARLRRGLETSWEQARSMLLHASNRWPKAVSASLWPYALHHAVNMRNNVTSNPDGVSPLAKFSKHKVKNNLFWKHQHTFGCPVFVLEAPLQGSIGGKGNGRTKPELASSLVTPSSTPPQLLWSSIRRLGMSLHSSMLCLMTFLTQSSKEETLNPFGKERLVWKTNSVKPSKLTNRTLTSKVHGSQTHLHLRPWQEDLNLQSQLRPQALNRHLNQFRQQ